ncbi:hypothetical protein RB195_014709 [Necator americanus]|uniref:Uncharacterized protein n=1 Tax=Necator americanus TaxID=51031 RepID=A0ABR1E195_NECAM
MCVQGTVLSTFGAGRSLEENRGHGQIYVAFSRVRTPVGLKVDTLHASMKRIAYDEVLAKIIMRMERPNKIFQCTAERIVLSFQRFLEGFLCAKLREKEYFCYFLLLVPC